MSWKVSPKKVMVTLLLIMITVYHSMTMLYYISGMDSSFLEKRYIIGTATMILPLCFAGYIAEQKNLLYFKAMDIIISKELIRHRLKDLFPF